MAASWTFSLLCDFLSWLALLSVSNRMKFYSPTSLLMASVFVAPAADLRLGIIGCDTSHAIAFTETLNNAEAKNHIAGAKVVAAFKGGSPDVSSSAKRVDEYAATLNQKYQVKLYDSTYEMHKNGDAVLLERS